MCGIFGFVAPPGAVRDHSRVQSAIRTLVELSEPRGREAAGVALVLPNEISVYRRPMAPSEVLAHPEFQLFLDTALPPGTSPQIELAGLGHCRLVTNGTQILERNNQPVMLDTIVGVHNGIVTNPEAMIAARAGQAGEAAQAADDVELDSAILFRNIEAELAAGATMANALRRTYQLMEGEASIAMFARERN